MAEGQVRLFVAVELLEEVKAYLTSLQGELKTKLPQAVRWVRPEGIHLTLKFLGNVASSLVPAVEAAVATGCRGARPFSLQLAGLGVFPAPKRPQVIWLGVEGEIEALLGLQRTIDVAMAPLGFAREGRPFSPHLTLGRVEESASAETRQRIGDFVDATKVTPDRSLSVHSVSLMQSRLQPGGAIYSCLSAISL